MIHIYMYNDIYIYIMIHIYIYIYIYKDTNIYKWHDTYIYIFNDTNKSIEIHYYTRCILILVCTNNFMYHVPTFLTINQKNAQIST